jgi:hypothetical protein
MAAKGERIDDMPTGTAAAFDAADDTPSASTSKSSSRCRYERTDVRFGGRS